MKTWKTIIQIGSFLLFFGYAAQVFFSAVYIKNFSSFPAYPCNTNGYMQGGALVGCGPTTGAMILAYFHQVNSLPSTARLLTNPGRGVNESLNTAKHYMAATTRIQVPMVSDLLNYRTKT